MGWPARSLATEWFSDDTTEHSVRLRSRDLVVIMYNNDGSLARRTMPDGSGLLPTRIIWSGMIINTLVWCLAGAAIAWCGWAVPAHVLGRSRRKRGLCPRCAHPVSGSRCTECGGPTRGVAPGRADLATLQRTLTRSPPAAAGRGAELEAAPPCRTRFLAGRVRAVSRLADTAGFATPPASRRASARPRAAEIVVSCLTGGDTPKCLLDIDLRIRASSKP
jgi:hypothetical protein